MKKQLINIAEQFSPYPAGRFATDGPFTGEGFRQTILVDAIKNNDLVTIDLDGAMAPGSSFLEEAFGGLVRAEGFTEAELLKKLEIVGKRDSIRASIFEYIKKAQKVKLGE